MTNGSKYTDGLTPILSREIYQWKDTKESGNDCPSVLWSSCYKAIATANHALEAIEKLESENNTVNLSAQRGRSPFMPGLRAFRFELHILRSLE